MGIKFSKWRVATTLCLLLIIMSLYVVLQQNHTENGLRLDILTKQLENIMQEHRALLAKYKRLSWEMEYVRKKSPEPSVEYEEMRRRIYTNIKDLWYYINHAMKRTLVATTNCNCLNLEEDMRDIVKETRNRKMSLLSDMEQLLELDGRQELRQLEATEVSALVQHRLYLLQNPSNCSKIDLEWKSPDNLCGTGCQLHHIMLCLIHAYGTRQTVIFDTVHEPVFSAIKPILGSCKSDQPQLNLQANRQQLNYTNCVIDSKFHPLSMPKDLALKVRRFNGDPASWWVGQVLKFALKLQPDVEADIQRIIKDWKTPIVGVHIRRTDKLIIEAAFHNVSEYMVHVKDYYDQLELTKVVDVRRVFLATDDIEAINEASLKYPEYQFLYDKERIKSAIPTKHRSKEGIRSVIVDMHLLSMCNYIVCTFSSNVCRRAYEMMQANRVDASNSFFSLDHIYHVPKQLPYQRKAVISHKGGRDEISFRVGDLMEVYGNHWNGYGIGMNKIATEKGLFPWYKTVEHLVMYETPLYNTTMDGAKDF